MRELKNSDFAVDKTDDWPLWDCAIDFGTGTTLVD